MKNKFLLLGIILISAVSFGQKNNRFEMNYSYLNSIFFEHSGGDKVSYSKYFPVHRIGVSYDRRLYRWFRAETGVDFLFSKYSTEFQGTPDYIEGEDSFVMVSFPLVLSIEFAKYFYLKGGISLDVQTNTPKLSDKQSGIGGILGLGLKYNYQDYTFSIGVENQRRRIKSFTESASIPNYLHHYGATISLGYNF